MSVPCEQCTTSPASVHKSGPPSASLGKAGCSDVVVCDAGQGYARSKDGLELHMATNYLGPFLLTMLLLPSLQRSASKVSNPPTIVTNNNNSNNSNNNIAFQLMMS